MAETIEDELAMALLERSIDNHWGVAKYMRVVSEKLVLIPESNGNRFGPMALPVSVYLSTLCKGEVSRENTPLLPSPPSLPYFQYTAVSVLKDSIHQPMKKALPFASCITNAGPHIDRDLRGISLLP